MLYESGAMSRHDDVCVLSGGLCFLISMDSVILSSATSLQVQMISKLNAVLVICSVVWCVLMCSPSGVFFVLLVALRRCSINLSRKALLVFLYKIYVCQYRGYR